jgi:hypothetical protein
VSLPASLISIGGGAFAGCVNLSTFIIDPDNPVYRHSDDNTMILYNAVMTVVAYPSAAGSITLNGITGTNPYAFRDCDALTSVILPAAIHIGDSAFSGCDALTSVSLPAATTIGDSAFVSCTALTDLTFGKDTAPWPTLAGNVFNSTGTGTPLTIHVPSGTVSDYTAAWGVPVSVPAGSSAYGSSDHKAITITDVP